MKEMLRSMFGGVGGVIYFLFAFAAAYYPLVFIDMPWWLCAIFAFFLSLLKPIYASICTFILYVIAMFSVSLPGIEVPEIFLFIFAGLFILLDAIPNIDRFIWAYRSIKNEQLFVYDSEETEGHQS